jgi:NAD(P)-dependent dehydrogenase (short-subunit alcohol dehydrogenase family)
MTTVDGRVVLLTGASKGIGAATARALGEAGAYLIAHYGSDLEGVTEATASIPEERKLLLSADFDDPAAPQALWEQAMAWRGKVDVLVNNAAVMDHVPFDCDDDQWQQGWQRAYAVNVLAPAALIRSALPHFRERGAGVIITVSSWVAQRGPGQPGLVAYAASKAAAKALTQTVARHYSVDGVLAYVIAPGVVNTRLSKQAAVNTGGEDAVTASLAMREWVPPEELAELIVFLSSGRVRHLSGATFDVNGATYIR